MELRDYLSIRRAYNLVRQDLLAARRLTFAEFAILCRLQMASGTLNTSEIAEYQQSLRPTMTHRTKHLESMGLIERSKGETDRRNVVCKLTDEGASYIDEICVYTCDALTPGRPLSRITPERVCRYVDSMGTVPCMAGDLVLLGLYASEDMSATVSELVELLGLLQPTVSMSAASLGEAGFLERVQLAGGAVRSTKMRLTSLGLRRVGAIAESISKVVVSRKGRTRSERAADPFSEMAEFFSND